MLQFVGTYRMLFYIYESIIILYIWINNNASGICNTKAPLCYLHALEWQQQRIQSYWLCETLRHSDHRQSFAEHQCCHQIPQRHHSDSTPVHNVVTAPSNTASSRHTPSLAKKTEMLSVYGREIVKSIFLQRRNTITSILYFPFFKYNRSILRFTFLNRK